MDKLARVGDENGELAFYTAKNGRHYVTVIVPAWEPHAGEHRRHAVADRQAAMRELEEIYISAEGMITSGPNVGCAVNNDVWSEGLS